MVPSSKSPFVVVVRFPLLGDALVPCAATAPSSELDLATPAYSRIANRNDTARVVDTVTVFAPLPMFSA